MIVRLHNVYARVIDATPHEENWLARFMRFDDERDRFYRDSSGKVAVRDPIKATLWDSHAKQYPAGLTARLIREAETAGHHVDVVDARAKIEGYVRRFEEVDPVVLAAIDYLRDYQRDAIERILMRSRGIVQIPTAGGKGEIPPALVTLVPARWLFVVPAGDLMHDIAKRIEARCGIEVGRIGDKHWTIREVTVATIQSLGAALRPVGRNASAAAKDKHDRVVKLLQEVQAIFIDEVHKLPADQAYAVAMRTPNAFMRIGVSATPMDRSDKRSVYAVGALGDLIYRITPKELIDLGFISRPKIRFVPCAQAGPQTRDYGQAYRALVVNSKKRNALVAAALQKAPKPAFVFVKLLKHGRELEKALRATGHRVVFVQGKTSTEQRLRVIEDLRWGRLDAAVCSDVFTTGINFPELASVIVATGGQSTIETLQRLGRGSRIAQGKSEFELWDVLDSDAGDAIGATSARWLAKHARARRRDYLKQGYEVVVVDDLVP